MASKVDAIDFGDITDGRSYATGASSSTRGILMGQVSNQLINTIDYVEI